MHIDPPDFAASKALVCVGVVTRTGTKDNAKLLDGWGGVKKEPLMDGKR